MTELSLSDTLLTFVINYGAPVLALVIFLAAAGIPLPSTLMVVAGGAFVRQGVLTLETAFALCLVAVLLGDSLSYALGRFARGWVLRRFSDSTAWRSAEIQFQRRGGLAIYLTRFLLTALAIPVNWVAGGSAYAYPRFIALDAAGELTWLAAYGGLGYLFGTQWEQISDLLSNFSGLLVGVLVLGVGLYALRRWMRRPQPAARPETEPVLER